jgi:hypothetical protein
MPVVLDLGEPDAPPATIRRTCPTPWTGAGADTVTARDEMRQALDVLLRRAQDAGAVPISSRC